MSNRKIANMLFMKTPRAPYFVPDLPFHLFLCDYIRHGSRTKRASILSHDQITTRGPCIGLHTNICDDWFTGAGLSAIFVIQTLLSALIHAIVFFLWQIYIWNIIKILIECEYKYYSDISHVSVLLYIVMCMQKNTGEVNHAIVFRGSLLISIGDNSLSLKPLWLAGCYIIV